MSGKYKTPLNTRVRTLQWKCGWYRKTLNPNYPPFFANVEPTNACNIHCRICALDDSRKKGFMDWTLFENVIEQCAEAGVTEIRLFLAGEPLLHKRLADMVRLVRERGMISCVHTNAVLLTQQRSLDLIQNGLDVISFSFHGDTAAEYEHIHVGAKFEPTIANIIQFLQIKKDHGGTKPYAIVQTAKIPQKTRSQMNLNAEFKARFNGLPLNEFRVIAAHTWAGQTDNVTQKRGAYYFPCQAPWQSISIVWDGRVLGCCGDLNGRMVLGDVRERTVAEIWRAGPLAELRKGLVSRDLDGFPLCRQCDAVWRRAHPLLGDVKNILLRKT